MDIPPGEQHGARPEVPAAGGQRRRIPLPSLDQITVEWNRFWRSIDRVNLIYPFSVERIHVIGRNRAAVPSDHDPF
jgi:endonuclease/exonuclease/phosphatase family metal-dependent hydrolase